MLLKRSGLQQIRPLATNQSAALTSSEPDWWSAFSDSLPLTPSCPLSRSFEACSGVSEKTVADSCNFSSVSGDPGTNRSLILVGRLKPRNTYEHLQVAGDFTLEQRAQRGRSPLRHVVIGKVTARYIQQAKLPPARYKGNAPSAIREPLFDALFDCLQFVSRHVFLEVYENKVRRRWGLCGAQSNMMPDAVLIKRFSDHGGEIVCFRNSDSADI